MNFQYKSARQVAARVRRPEVIRPATEALAVALKARKRRSKIITPMEVIHEMLFVQKDGIPLGSREDDASGPDFAVERGAWIEAIGNHPTFAGIDRGVEVVFSETAVDAAAEVGDEVGDEGYG